MIFVSPVPVESIGLVWDRCKPFLTKATDESGGRETILTLYSKLKLGFSVLWIIMIDNHIVGAATTEVTDWKSLHVSFLGGSRMNEWLDEFIKQLREYAQHNGCINLEMTGRKGWLRSLAEFGFKEEPYVSMRLAL
jgi:hypothetical protein